ncbi:MAG TPA: hypothetical protein VIK24_00715 [Pyrinomonadaceae bacterium]
MTTTRQTHIGHLFSGSLRPLVLFAFGLRVMSLGGEMGDCDWRANGDAQPESVMSAPIAQGAGWKGNS